jgi:hypothetical protein
MSHLDNMYKLGAARAVADFTRDVNGGFDNPTAEPPMKMAGQRAVERILKEAAKKGKPKANRPRTISRAPQKGNPGLNRLKSRIKRNK